MIFKPDEELRKAVLDNLAFEDDGVLADGIDYASRTSYLKVVKGGGGGGEEERPGEL